MGWSSTLRYGIVLPSKSKEAKTIKLLRETVDTHLLGLGLGNDFLDMTLKAQQQKGGDDKCDFIKTKNCCTWKDTIKKTKRPRTEWEKIFAIIYLGKV